MSEKIFALLLRIYPSRFRKLYEGEALQLIRDRLRDERGFPARARLCWDLVADAVTGLPQAFQNTYAGPEAASIPAVLAGVPSFRLLQKEPLRPGPILVGSVLSLTALAGLGFVLNHSINVSPTSPSRGPSSPVESVIQRLNQPVLPAPPKPPSPESGQPVNAHPISANPATPAANVSQSRSLAAADSTMLARSPQREVVGAAGNAANRSSSPTQSPANSEGASTPANAARFSSLSLVPGVAHAQNRAPVQKQAAPDEANLDAAERRRIIDGAAADLKQFYFDPNVAQKTADALLAHEKSGDDSSAMDGAAFASLLTTQMRDASQDMHLVMEYSPGKLPDGPPVQTADDRARYRSFLEQNNCFFRKVEMLPHEIGYLKLDWFADPAICKPTAEAAMASLNNARALIFDLRDNRGGDPSATALLAAYLFDRPEYWYNPRGAPSEGSWTRSPVAGNRLADKPVYVLTSASTWSGAEQFSYDLKMLKRATLVGETTRGGAHAGVFHRIDDHFGIGIPEVKAINPYGTADWEGVGVEPNDKVRAADALQEAIKLAEERIGKR